MEQPPQRKILFSYTNFLANSNPKSITFIEAFKELISTFLDELVITMPYGLDEAQLNEIEALAQCRIHLQDDDKENIIIYLTD